MPDSDFSPEEFRERAREAQSEDVAHDNRPIETGDADLDRLLSLVAPPRSIPFVWQHGNRLLMLSHEAGSWTFADLWFDSDSCTYEERHRAIYVWEREAIGVVLSRALAAGPESVESAARAMDRWLVAHFGHTIEESRTFPKTSSR